MKKKVFPVHVYSDVSVADKIPIEGDLFQMGGEEVKGIGEKDQP